MNKKVLGSFFFLFLIQTALQAENSYCEAMCRLSCDNFYKKEGVTSRSDPAAIKLCIDSCMDKKCLDD